MNVCFCCVRFCFSILSKEIGLRNVSDMTGFVLSGMQGVHNVRPACDGRKPGCGRLDHNENVCTLAHNCLCYVGSMDPSENV